LAFDNLAKKALGALAHITSQLTGPNLSGAYPVVIELDRRTPE